MTTWTPDHSTDTTVRIDPNHLINYTATDGSTVQIPAAKLTRGTNLFECMIHPWMQTKVTVE